jgi:hypothetical protein
MNEQTQKMLEQLAAKLGTTVEYLWGVLVKQAHIEFWSDILWYLVTFSIVFVGYKIGSKLWDRANKAKEARYEDEEGWQIGAGLTWAVSAIVGLIAVWFIPTTLYKILNPEYWALEKILTLLQ